MLDNIKNDAGSYPLTPLSSKFLQTPSHQRKFYVALFKDNPLKRQTVITCLDTLKKAYPEDDAISCVVIGTESRDLYILDPEAFTVLYWIRLPNAPVFIRSTGLYDVDYRILVACRNGEVLVYKKGTTTPKFRVCLNSHPVGVERVGKSIVIATMNRELICYSNKMKTLWNITTPADITAFALMDYKPKNFKGVVVGLSNMEVRVYRDKFLIDTLEIEDIPVMLAFGKYGREDSNLIIVTKNGSFNVFILKRSTDLSQGEISASIGPAPQQSQKLNVPRKTKTYVDQTLRERESGIQIHRQFTHDIYRMRFKTAQNYVEALQKHMTPISTSDDAPLKMAANVQGLGPVFRVTIEIMNTSTKTPIMGAYLLLVTNETLYLLDKTYINLPLLVPSLTYNVNVNVRCTSDQGIVDAVNVFVYVKGKTAPVLTANIDMPVSETAIML